MTMTQTWRRGWGLLFRTGLFFGCIRLVLIPTDALELLLPDQYADGVGSVVKFLYALIVIPLCAPFLAALSGVGVAFTGFFEKNTSEKETSAMDNTVHQRQ